MMSGSTVLKNSAQLCSWDIIKYKVSTGDQKTEEKDECTLVEFTGGNFYLQKLLLLRKTEYLRADNAGAGLQGEHGAYERLCLALPLHHGRYLDHRVFVGLWENSCRGDEIPVVRLCVCFLSANGMRTQANKSKPFLPAHSMSKLRTRSGAILCHSPSAGWLIKSVQPTSTSYWHKETCRGKQWWNVMIHTRDVNNLLIIALMIIKNLNYVEISCK